MPTAVDIGGHLPVVRFIVVHYTAGTTLAGAVRTLTAKDDNYVSAHVCVGRDGQVVQMVPFDRVAYHCGKSTWKGYTGLNAHSVGVELVNPGYWRPGLPLDGWDTIHARHRHGGPLRDWYTYTEAQYAYVRHIHSLFPAAELVGHDDIAPHRKTDPGPAWDWSRVQPLGPRQV